MDFLSVVLSPTPMWLMLAWIAILILFSPVLFVIGVCLPEIPLLILRRICYIPFDAV